MAQYCTINLGSWMLLQNQTLSEKVEPVCLDQELEVLRSLLVPEVNNFLTQYEFIEPVLPHAAQLGILFFIYFTTHS